MKASEVLEEAFVKCDNCGENFKTEHGFKDHCDQAHRNLPKSHKYEWTTFQNINFQNINKKGLKKHHKMKHNSSQCKKLVIFLSVELLESRNYFKMFLLSHLTLSKQQTTF